MDYGELIPILVGMCCILTIACVVVVIVFLCKVHTYLTWVDCLSDEIKDLEWSDNRIVSWLFDMSMDVNGLLKRHHMKGVATKRKKQNEKNKKTETKYAYALVAKLQEWLARK